jgi:hypothetical protein
MTKQTAPDRALTLGALALREELAAGRMQKLGVLESGGLKVEVLLGRDSLWAIVRRPDRGALALRCAYAFGGGLKVERIDERRWRGEAAVGVFDIELRFEQSERTVLRCTSRLTPSAELLVTYLPRDLYPLSADDDPEEAKGGVEAAQRGLNSGLLFLTLRDPAFGGALYFQNLTALNPYFQALKTQPDGAVGGEWPELGYQPPTSPTGDSPPVNPLPKGETVTLSDALIAFEANLPEDEQQIARQFLGLLADIYPLIDRPTPTHHDWPERAERTLRDLQTSPKASLRHYGHRYLHPYTAAEYPDSMVQLAVLAAIVDHAEWKGESHPLEDELRAGLGRFYDPKLKTIRRYLPNVGDDKDADAVDSWYLYHPLTNLARLAEKGDGKARKLLEDSLDFAIKAARRFDYAWPIQYNVKDFSVITAARNDSGLGQTDVGGLYAYLMLQAHGLFGDERYLEEAKTALRKARGMQFELAYQANLTAWGAVAALKLWRMTGDEDFRQQSHVFLASFFHNSLIWESDLKTAKHFHNFLGVTCLHDAPYMAMYECYESMAAFDEYLAAAPEGIDRAARLLVTEYRRYALDRAWSYYPDALPPEALATDIRNGHIDRELSFPVEDLYADGQAAGQVGQEIYGCGAAFVFTAHAFHRLPGAPFQLFCDYPLSKIDALGPREFVLKVDGAPNLTCALRILGDAAKPSLRMNGARLRRRTSRPHVEWQVPGGAEVTLRWG